jgi:nitrite reductase/ring-hydroxylating ferredoxin subunit
MTDNTTTPTVICRLDELQDPDSRSMSVTHDGQQRDIFIVRQGRQVFGYLNSCPHTGGPLDWVPGQFLNLDKDHIQCATHAALFRFSDGECVAGPCKGDHLRAVPVAVAAGEVILLAAVPDPGDS